MKQIVNLIITIVVLYIFATFFPELVTISDTKSLILAAFLLFVAEIVVIVALFVFMAFALIYGDILTFLLGAVMTFFGEIIAIYLVDHWLPGVSFHSFWAMFIVAFILSVFRLQETNNSD